MNSVKHKTMLVILLSVILLCLVIFLIFIYKMHAKASHFLWNTNTYEESNELLNNPYMGWYNIYQYEINPDSAYTKDTIRESYESDSSTKLSLVEINLKSYPNGPIDEHGIKQIETILTETAAQDKSIILRFLYDWDGNAIVSEPKSLDIVLAHMGQIAPIVNAHADQIYTMQGIFVGDYAEMHDSNYLSTEQMKLLMNKLADVISPSITLSVRTPDQWRILNQTDAPLQAADAYQGTFSSRLGLFNDGMMASESDYGTYADENVTNKQFDVKWNREDELQFQHELCNYVPNGGETLISNSFNDLNNAIKSMSLMHISFLNNEFDENVINKWKNTAYTSDAFDGNDKIFDHMSGYDYLTAHMGYRYCVNKTELKQTKKQSGLSVEVKNNGFSSSYHTFKVVINAVDKSTNQQFSIPVDTDTRFWLGNQTVALDIPLDESQLPKGTYALSITVTDPISQSNIKFATTQDLGELTVK